MNWAFSSRYKILFSLGKRDEIRTTSLLLIFTFLALSYFPSSYSQQAELKFEDVPLSEGVQPSVQYIYQDRIGYLWFVTWSGLYKYDGYTFTTYQHDVDDSTSLFDNTLTTIYEDKDGILWIGSHFGLERFDRKSEIFKHFIPNPKDTMGNASNEVSAIYEDKFGTLWIGTNYGLYKFDRTNSSFTCVKHDSTDPGSIASNSVRMICVDKQGNIWFGTNAGLDKFDFKTGRFNHYYYDSYAKDKTGYNSPLMFWTNCIIEDDKNILWIGTERGLVEFNTRDDTFINHLFIPKDPINSITSISKDVVTSFLWLATATDGLFSFDKKTKKFTHFNFVANYLLSERSGTLWLGTDTGIKKLNMVKQPFKKYPMPEPVRLIANGREGEIWFMSSGKQWNKFDTQKEKLIPYSFGKYRLTLVMFFRAGFFLRNRDGSLIIQDTLGRTIFSLDSSWKDYVSLTSMACQTDGGVYIGGWDGHFDFWDFKSNQVIKIRKFQQAPRYIYKDSIGLVWIATYMGELYWYNPADGTFKKYIIDTRNPASLSGNRINQIYEDKKTRLWFATNAGLNRLDRSTDSFIHFTVKNGLSSDNIRGILEDDHGNLWLNTSKGISKFDPEIDKCKNYDISYGLDTPTDYSYGIGCKTRNGEMFFGCAGGLTRFHPDSVKDNSFISPIVITSFNKFDKPYRFSNNISVPYDENFLSFEFAALSYISSERNLYAYKLEGLDKNWVYSGTRRYVSYPNLDPGEYVFRVKGSNNDGIWNETGTSISIIISPPWWKTTWAYIFYSLLILSTVYTTWKLQLKRIRLSHEYEMSKFEAEKLHEVDELKSRFFANISHEFRTPLTLILGPANDIIDNTKETKTKQTAALIKRNAGRLLGLVNQLLDLSKVEAGKMKLETREQNIIPLLKGLTLSFSSLAERRETTLRFNTIEERLNVFLDKDKIEKIVNNILSNAFKFTPEGGKVDVTVEKMIKEVEIRISDSGKGISTDHIDKIFDRFYQADGSRTREQEGTGIGLALTKELVEIHKGKIRVESETGKGTTFIVSIPLGKEHLKPEEIVEVQGADAAEYVVKETELVLEPENRKEKSDIDEIMEIELSADKTGKPLLLIVEDNPDVRKYIIGHLEDNYRIQEAFDGEDGLKQAINHIPDLIISDVMMPKMDGFQLCSKLKTDERTSHIPIIMLTAKATSQDKIAGYETGADDYIMKPFESDELLARIKNLIEQRKKLREHFRKEGLIGLEDKNINSTDKKFLKKSIEIINTHMADTDFSVDNFADEVGMSRSQLHRKLVSFIGESPGDLTRRIRLSKAAKLIEQKFGNISEVALEVGFSNPANFAQSFKKQFGVSPSEYEQRLNP